MVMYNDMFESDNKPKVHEPPTMIAMDLECLGDRLDGLDNILSTLEDRLEVVLRPAMTEPTDPSEMVNKAEGRIRSGLGSAIDRRARQVSYMMDHVDTLLARLEL